MKKKTIGPYVFFILLSLAVSGLSAMITRHGMPVYDQLEKPFFTPPALAFPIVWTLLYLLMGIGAARVWRTENTQRQHALFPFFVQLILNFFWTVWFFGLGKYLLAFFWLLALIAAILWMIRAFSKMDRWAGRLQIPYLIWCIFAAVLNLAIFFLNR